MCPDAWAVCSSVNFGHLRCRRASEARSVVRKLSPPSNPRECHPARCPAAVRPWRGATCCFGEPVHRRCGSFHAEPPWDCVTCGPSLSSRSARILVRTTPIRVLNVKLLLAGFVVAHALMAVLVSGCSPSTLRAAAGVARLPGCSPRGRGQERRLSPGQWEPEAVRGVRRVPPPCRPFEGSSTRVLLDGRLDQLIGSSGSSMIDRSRSSGVTTPIGAPSSPTTTNRWM